MIYLVPLLGLLTTIAGWILIGLTMANILSGTFEDRTCLTDCVRTYFFYSTAAGLAGLTFGLFALRNGKSRKLGYIGLGLTLPLCAIIGTLFVIGNAA